MAFQPHGGGEQHDDRGTTDRVSVGRCSNRPSTTTTARTEGGGGGRRRASAKVKSDHSRAVATGWGAAVSSGWQLQRELWGVQRRRKGGKRRDEERRWGRRENLRY